MRQIYRSTLKSSTRQMVTCRSCVRDVPNILEELST